MLFFMTAHKSFQHPTQRIKSFGLKGVLLLQGLAACSMPMIKGSFSPC